MEEKKISFKKYVGVKHLSDGNCHWWSCLFDRKMKGMGHGFFPFECPSFRGSLVQLRLISNIWVIHNIQLCVWRPIKYAGLCLIHRSYKLMKQLSCPPLISYSNNISTVQIICLPRKFRIGILSRTSCLLAHMSLFMGQANRLIQFKLKKNSWQGQHEQFLC